MVPSEGGRHPSATDGPDALGPYVQCLYCRFDYACRGPLWSYILYGVYSAHEPDMLFMPRARQGPHQTLFRLGQLEYKVIRLEIHAPNEGFLIGSQFAHLDDTVDEALRIRVPPLIEESVGGFIKGRGVDFLGRHGLRLLASFCVQKEFQF